MMVGWKTQSKAHAFILSHVSDNDNDNDHSNIQENSSQWVVFPSNQWAAFPSLSPTALSYIWMFVIYV